MKNIKSVGIIGAGTMGSALAQKLAQENFQIILCDKAIDALERGVNKIELSLQEAVNKKVLDLNKKEKIKKRIIPSTHFEDLKNVDLIIEAVFENFEVKTKLFKEISSVVNPDTIIATNTSSFSVTELSQYVSNPERFIGLHYFYHAAKNRLVEIIPGNWTSQEVFKSVYYFSLKSGKDPIVTQDTYGFVVNRFFVPWLNESVRIYEEGIATPEQIDAVAMKCFGISMGPFALMNATGVSVAYHAEKTLEAFGVIYRVANLLKKQAESKQDWEIEIFEDVDKRTEEIISKRLLGVVFFVVTQILHEKVCSPTDLNKGAKIGLKWKKGPVEMMKRMSLDKVNNMIKDYALLYKEPPITIEPSYLKLEWITSKIIGSVGYIIFNRPEELNALNEEVFKQLENCLIFFNLHKAIDTIILTATGKAFIAGADIKFFIQNIENNQIDKIVEFTRYAHSILHQVDSSPKRIIAVLNGLTLGGGLELALCADEIYALPNVVMAFPETGIGIYPGLGGTQRTQKRIGKKLTKYLIFTGKHLRTEEASEIHLIDKVISFDEYIRILEGDISNLYPLPIVPIPEKWKEIERKMQNINIDNLNSDTEMEKIIRKKAPLAVKYADLLINDGKGPESEITYLKNIFSSEDALNGLKNIGKNIEYKGR